MTTTVALTEDALHALGRRWAAGEKITALAREAGVVWNKLYSDLDRRGYNPKARPAAAPVAVVSASAPPDPASTPTPTEPSQPLPELPPAAFQREEDGSAAAALVAKYRPRCLDEVLGQDEIVRSLKRFAAAPYPCAMLFAGESGTGKTSAAVALAHDLGCAVADEELGGLFEIPSGSQSADAVRHLLDLLRYRPLTGSGWRVCIVNECDRMALPCETIWLDALEHLPPCTVVVFTTNDTSRLSRRFRDRCETYTFAHATEILAPWIQAMAKRVWEREVGEGEPPDLDRLGLPTMGDVDSFHASFRLALQQLQRHVRQAARSLAAT